MIAMPQELWHEERAITLAPNETKTFVFNASTNLPANKLFSISMMVVDSSKALPDVNSPVTGANAKLRPVSISQFGIAGLNFSTVPPGKGLAFASTQNLPQ